ncbi:MAG TPA: outer membrane beta-barrel protein, partial [Pseudolabrys sp.]|nr:outer membrane beta-barrel protein [Pseudolabrys sp.]
MPRLRPLTPVTPRGARLLMAACVALWSADAVAQTAAPPFPDSLAPNLQTDPHNPPRFQKFTRPGLAQLGPPANFSAPASGAGITGFDSTNARKKTKPKGRASPGNPRAAPSIANAASPNANAAAANARAIAPGVATPLAVSPYQTPPPDTGAFAQAPGAPPVELGPIRKLPPKRKANSEPDDPYAALGVHAGAFTLFPAIELIGGYDTNPARASGGAGATLYTVAPELQVQSNWSRHELKADLRGSYTGYSPDQTPTLSRPNFNGNVDGRIDVTRDTRIDLATRLLVSTDNPGSPNLQADLAKLPLFATFGGSAGIGQRFNRFDLAVKGDVERTVYQNSTLTDGSITSNADRQYNQFGGTLRGSYEMTPGVKPFVEVRADTRVHDIADTRVHDINADISSYQRDSKGLAGTIGTTFELTRQLTGDVGVGYTRRNYEDPRLEQIKGLIVNGSLIWTASALTTAKLSAVSSVGESTVPGVSGQLSRDIGLQVD